MARRRPGSPKGRWRTLISVIACIATFGMTNGLSSPLIALNLEAQGVGEAVIGLNMTMMAVAILVFSPFVPKLAAWSGTRRFLLGCILVQIAVFVVMPLERSLVLWFAARFVMGCTAAGMYVIAEAWIAEVAHDASRGRTMAIYVTALSGGFAIGPLIIPITGIEGFAPFLAAIALLFMAALPLASAGQDEPDARGPIRFNAFNFAIIAPTIATAVVLVSLMEMTTAGLLAVYAVRYDFPVGVAALTGTAVALGGLVFQFPIGWLGDKTNRVAVMLLCAGGGALGALLLPQVITHPILIWLFLPLWAGLFSGVYTMALALMGERFKGAELITASASLGIMWGIGSLIGPASAGAIMSSAGPDGLPYFLAACCAVFVALGLLRRLAAQRRARIGNA